MTPSTVSGSSYIHIVFRRIQKNHKVKFIILGLLIYIGFEMLYAGHQTHKSAHVAQINNSEWAYYGDIAGRGFLEAVKWILRSILITLMVTVISDAIKGVDAEFVGKFEGLFRISSHSYERTAIVVPHFDRDYFIKYLTDKHYTCTEPAGLSQQEKDLIAKKKFVSLSDMMSARIISGLFQKTIRKMPDIITDQEAYDLITKKDDRYLNYVLIGLYSNKVVKDIVFEEKNDHSLVHERKIVDELRFAPGTRGPEATRQMKIRFKGADHLMEENMNNKDLDIAVFSTFKWAVDGMKLNLTIIGGLNATGTEVMAHTLFRDWMKLADATVTTRRNDKPVEAHKLTTSYTKIFRIRKKDPSQPCSGYDMDNVDKVIDYGTTCLL